MAPAETLLPTCLVVLEHDATQATPHSSFPSTAPVYPQLPAWSHLYAMPSTYMAP